MPDNTSAPQSSFLGNLVLSVIFIALLSAPLTVMLFSTKAELSNTEMRTLATLPKLGASFREWQAYPGQLEKYFNDHFGLRSQMIATNSFILLEWLHTSPVPKVIIGKEGWLYLALTPTLEAFRGHKSLSEKDLERWRIVHERRHDWLAARGIKYLYAVAPDKDSVYPQFLPTAIEAAKGVTPLDQLLQHMEQHPRLPILDLREALKTASANQQTYYQTDSHWNHIGAHIGYREIVKTTAQWFPKETGRPLASFPVRPSHQSLGELARMIGSQGADIEEHIRPSATCGVTIELGLEGFDTFDDYKIGHRFTNGILRTQCPEKSLRVVVFRDSFFTAMLPFFADQYQDVIYVWSNYDDALMKKILENFQPDLVIEERVQRALMSGVH